MNDLFRHKVMVPKRIQIDCVATNLRDCQPCTTQGEGQTLANLLELISKLLCCAYAYMHNVLRMNMEAPLLWSSGLKRLFCNSMGKSASREYCAVALVYTEPTAQRSRNQGAAAAMQRLRKCGTG